MTEKEKVQLEMLEKGELFLYQIKNPTEEMLWFGVKNKSLLIEGQILTKDMIMYIIKDGRIPPRQDNIDFHDIPEDVWVEGLKKTSPKDILFNEYFSFVKDNAKMTKNIAVQICLESPFAYKCYNLVSYCDEKNKEDISNKYFQLLKENTEYVPKYNLPPDLPISEEQWRWMVDSNYLFCCTGRVENYIGQRNDVPEFVIFEYLKKEEYLKEYANLTKEEMIYWINEHKYNLDSWRCSESIKNYIKCKDISGVILECGWFFKYWRNQSLKICKAAIQADPFNIKYVKKPTDELRILALSLNKNVKDVLDKKTEAVCKFLGEEFDEEKINLYPAQNYFVKFDEDVCDESNIVKVCIIPGTEMEEFMSRTTKVSFGNLDDTNELEVSKIAKYQPITNEEIMILKKFGLDNLHSGYFSNLD